MALPRHGQLRKLYISTLELTIGSMQAQDDENGVERVVYYLSWTLIDAKTRYSLIKKLCLALYFSYTKLKYYLISCDVLFISQVNVTKYMFFAPMLHNQVGKWMLAFIEVLLHFVLAKAVKGQVLADFIVDHPVLEIEEVDVGLIELKP